MLSNSITENYGDRHVCVLGLGYVGLTLAAVMAEVGFNISGVEIRDDIREKLNAAKAHFFEPGLNEKLQRAALNGRLKVYAEIPKDCAATVFVITVGTPIGADGRVNLQSVTRIAHEIAERLKDGDLVILRSTVKIGTTENVVHPILAQTGKNVSVAYCPERTVEGQALAELRYLPQVIGAADRATVNRAAQLFSFLTPTVIRVSNAETAELIKLIDNAKRDVMFAYANEVARMCDKLGVSAAEVIHSGRFGYSRTDLPMPGPVGGPCLSKDSHILAESLEHLGLSPEITVAARRVNERQPKEIAEFLRSYAAARPSFAAAPKIALLGIAFKGRPVTDDTRGTMAVPVFEALRLAFPKGRFVAHDPVVDQATLKSLGLEPVASLEDAFQDAQFVLVLNNHPAYGAMPVESLADLMARPGAVYDCWNNFTDQAIHLPRDVSYIALGSQGVPIVG